MLLWGLHFYEEYILMPFPHWHQNASSNLAENGDGLVKPQVFTLPMSLAPHLLVEGLHISMPLRGLHLDGVI